MDSKTVRQKFFDFFKRHAHTVVPSSSLIPAQDPTLLFANAGMNQFKDVFLGKEKRSYTRAVSIQKCMRAGGKHNDLENVGFTKRHLTFFEMMGNFSFGDYFKKEAITFAWHFITQELDLDKSKLYATVYKKDDEAYEIWHKHIGLPESQIYRLGEADNFWQMGDTGPCGPCSEIYIDRGQSFGCRAANCAPGCSCDRFLEFWNLVFMQFDRQTDGTDKPLKQVGVDTGMGLERLCAILQNKDSVFETDLFMPIINHIEQLTGHSYRESVHTAAACNVLADHVRSATFLIADGCSPSNEGRGYVLRKIIRRAALFAKKLTTRNIFPELALVVIQTMKEVYPNLVESSDAIQAIITSEIEKFWHNLEQGQLIIDKYLQENATSSLTGEQVFKLYDTYGFPLELTKVIAHEKNITLDLEGFERAMQHQREQSTKKVQAAPQISLPETLTTEFVGYTQLQTTSTITGLIHYNHVVKTVGASEPCWIICSQTPFYVECGGQVNDQGTVIIEGQETPILDLKKIDNAIAIAIKAPVELALGQQVIQKVTESVRRNTMKNHTATHLLQAALMQRFGKQIKQAGSLVNADYLRFDFTYHENLTPEDIASIEEAVNNKIMENIALIVEQSTLKEATDKGVIAFFGDKYNPDKVRVVQVPGFSAELCGGTHVRATGDIGCFKITESTALSAGQRRLVAVTGPQALALYQKTYATLKGLGQEFKVPLEQVTSAIEKQKEQLKASAHQIKNIKKQFVQAMMSSWHTAIQDVNAVPFLLVALHDYTADELKDIATQLQQHKPGFYFVYSLTNNAVTFYCSLAEQYTQKISLEAFSGWLKEQGLRAGGKQNSLQGGGTKMPDRFEELLAKKIATISLQ